MPNSVILLVNLLGQDQPSHLVFHECQRHDVGEDDVPHP